MSKPYNEKDIDDIVRYAKKLIGKTFQDIVDTSTFGDKTRYEVYNPRHKGFFGNLLEELYFDIPPNSRSESDFKYVGMDLKSTPYEERKNSSKKQYQFYAGERLSLGMIPYDKPFEVDFFKSHVWEKCSNMLLVLYLRDPEAEDKLSFPINFVEKFNFPDDDLKIIIEDYKKIAQKIISGQAHELSEGDTMYLGACTKGATAAKSLATQYYNHDIKAKKRSFSLKQSYMTYLLNEVFMKKDNSESLLSDTSNKHIIEAYRSGKISFEEMIAQKVAPFIGQSDLKLSQLFDVKVHKSYWYILAMRMLGIKKEFADEFLKANIIVKAIRVEENDTIKEHSPFPTFSALDIIEEEWDDSSLKNYLEETRFLFFVFKNTPNGYIFRGIKFWNMPQKDIEIGHKCWEQLKDTIRDGVSLTPKIKGGKYVVENNLPKIRENEVLHVRPHASKSYHVLGDGTPYGTGSLSDTDLLPDGRRMTKQSFWMNNTYVLKQIKDLLD